MASEKSTDEIVAEIKASIEENVRTILKEAVSPACFISVPPKDIVDKFGAFCAHHCECQDEECDPDKCPVVQIAEKIEGPKES